MPIAAATSRVSGSTSTRDWPVMTAVPSGGRSQDALKSASASASARSTKRCGMRLRPANSSRRTALGSASRPTIVSPPSFHSSSSRRRAANAVTIASPISGTVATSPRTPAWGTTITRPGSAAMPARKVPWPINMPSSPMKPGAWIVTTVRSPLRSTTRTEPRST